MKLFINQKNRFGQNRLAAVNQILKTAIFIVDLVLPFIPLIESIVDILEVIE